MYPSEGHDGWPNLRGRKQNPNIFNNFLRPKFWAPSPHVGRWTTVCSHSVGRSVGRVKREPHNLEKYHFPCRFAAAVLSSGKGDKGGGWIAGSQHSAGDLSLSVPIGEQSKTTNYRAALKEASHVWNLGEMLPFVYLLQGRKTQFFHRIST